MRSSTNNHSKKPGRTTSYPRVDLESAIDLLNRLKNALGNGPYDRNSAATAMGYKGLSGASASRFAALLHYGLLSRNGTVYNQSPLADRILIETSEEDKKTAIVEAVRNPKLYKSLTERFSGSSLPLLLKNILVRDYGIPERASRGVVKNFKQSLEFAGILRNGVISNLFTRTEESPSKERETHGVIPGESLEEHDMGNKRQSLEEIRLPSGIIVSFPSKLNYSVAIGKFSAPLEQLEKTSQDLLKEIQRRNSADLPDTGVA